MRSVQIKGGISPFSFVERTGQACSVLGDCLRAISSEYASGSSIRSWSAQNKAVLESSC